MDTKLYPILAAESSWYCMLEEKMDFSCILNVKRFLFLWLAEFCGDVIFFKEVLDN